MTKKYLSISNFFITLAAALICLFLCTNKAYANDNKMRVVSLAPSITQTLIVLGLEDNIVGISTYCEELPNGSDITRVGIGKNFNAESVLMLEPDLVLGLDALNFDYLPYYQIKTKNLNEILYSFVYIASLMNEAKKGEELYAKCMEHIVALRKEFSSKPSRTVLFVLQREKDNDGLIYQITAAGNDGYFSELLKILNVQNAVKSNLAYPILSFENIQAIDPDEIVDVVAPELMKSLALENWQKMPLKAVKNNNVYISNLGVVPGPGFIDFLDELARELR